MKKSVIRIFEKFIRKNLYQSFFLNKVSGFRPATLLKSRLRSFPVDFTKLNNHFFTEHLWTAASNTSKLILQKTKALRAFSFLNAPILHPLD